MNVFLRERIRTTGCIVNMTSESIRLYDDFTGDIVTFFPDARRFSQERTVRLFPKEACYVFTPDMLEDVDWFQDYCGNAAVIVGRDCGRGGVEIVRLVSADCGSPVRFSRSYV